MNTYHQTHARARVAAGGGRVHGDRYDAAAAGGTVGDEPLAGDQREPRRAVAGRRIAIGNHQSTRATRTGSPVTNQLLCRDRRRRFRHLVGALSHHQSAAEPNFTYTAPPAGRRDGSNVAIRVRPSGTDNASLFAGRQYPTEPRGTINTGGLPPVFVFLPADPAANQTVRFDGSASTASRGATITRYDWSFGDGRHGEWHSVVTHAYRCPERTPSD